MIRRPPGPGIPPRPGVSPRSNEGSPCSKPDTSGPCLGIIRPSAPGDAVLRGGHSRLTAYLFIVIPKGFFFPQQDIGLISRPPRRRRRRTSRSRQWLPNNRPWVDLIMKEPAVETVRSKPRRLGTHEHRQFADHPEARKSDRSVTADQVYRTQSASRCQ